MKILEIISFVLFIFSIALSFMEFPGHTFLMVISVMILSIYYFFFGFWTFSGKNLMKKKEKDIENPTLKDIIFSIVLGLVFSFQLISILNYLQGWTGDNVLLISGTILSVIGIICYYFLTDIKRQVKTYTLLRGIIIILIGSLVLVI